MKPETATSNRLDLLNSGNNLKGTIVETAKILSMWSELVNRSRPVGNHGEFHKQNPSKSPSHQVNNQLISHKDLVPEIYFEDIFEEAFQQVIHWIFVVSKFT